MRMRVTTVRSEMPFHRQAALVYLARASGIVWNGDQNRRIALQILGRIKSTSDRGRYPDASGVWWHAT
jgi:hypothetical protein